MVPVSLQVGVHSPTVVQCLAGCGAVVQEVEAGFSGQVFFQFLLDTGTLHHHYLAYFIDNAPEGGAIRG